MSPVRRPPRRRRPDGLQHGRGVAAGVPSRRSNWTAGCSLNFEARLHQLLGAIPYLEGGLSNLRLPVLNAHAVPSLPSKYHQKPTRGSPSSNWLTSKPPLSIAWPAFTSL